MHQASIQVIKITNKPHYANKCRTHTTYKIKTQLIINKCKHHKFSTMNKKKENNTERRWY